MRRAVWVYAALLLAALVTAYLTWTHEGDPDLSESVMVLSGEPDELESVEYTSDKLELTITMKEDEHGRYAWVRAVPLEADEPPEPSPDNPHAPPPVDTEPEEFKAGPAGDTVIEGLAPFLAKRTLEITGDDKLAELGLDEPDAKLTISRAGREPKTFELGGNVFGGANVYVRDPETGAVHLVDAKLIRPLQTGKRTLPDRGLVAAQTKDIKTLTVKTAEASASFQQHNPDDPQAVFWSTAGETEANPSAAAWIDKVLRLRSSAYVPEDEAPTDLEEVYTYAVETTDGKTTTVHVYRTYGDASEPSEEAGATPAIEDQWYARSEHTRSLVKLHRSLAAETAADLGSALGTEAPTE